MTQLNKLWEFQVDNNFATSVFSNQTAPDKPTITSRAPKFCGKCLKLDFWVLQFRIEDIPAELEEQSKICEFCKLRWDLCKDLDRNDFPVIYFDRSESMLRMNERYPPVLSICRQPEPKASSSMLGPIQIGLPELSAVGSERHFRTLRRWVEFCDSNHPNCHPQATATLPTRLIDVGEGVSGAIKLYQTQKSDVMKYIALSHPWGLPPHFCTFRSNMEEHMQEIKFSKLPATFKDAITVSRELGFRYLWIDSICIIQGPDGDFNDEAKKMEDVFSSASCVIAASSAKGQVDGFLKERAERKYLTFVREGLPPIHVCQFIDDFAQHVLDGSLNKRGWVLQERALARRTIYFTDKQTYWECGGGVRCETLTKMNNTLASFIGDPNFPEVALRSSRGGKIRLYQDLYTQYSRLQFSWIGDRPMGIGGLEKRLIRDFATRGGFGVFDDGQGLLHRSLLWHRGTDEHTMDKILYPADRQLMVPTWSWMAYKGGIDYLDLPFGGVEWEKQEIHSPWTPGSHEVWHTGDQAGVTEISAIARDLNLTGTSGPESKLIFDVPARSSGPSQPMKCVVVGKLKSGGKDEQNRMHYVLLIGPKASQATRGGHVYERIGVGHVLGKWIKLNESGTMVKIW